LNESAVTPMAGRLLRMELVHRTHDEIDAPAWNLALSKQGKDVVKGAKSPFGTVNAVVDNECSEAEIHALVGYLNRLVEALE
jgi:DNA-binding MarR family transcriptional regulator